MSFNIRFAGEGTLADLMNKLIDDLGLSWFARFQGKNIAPVFNMIIEEFPLLGKSRYSSEWSPFVLEVPGGTCIWSPLVKDEYTGGFVFCPVPRDPSSPDPDFTHFNVELSDALRIHCDQVTIIDRGEVEELSMATSAIQLFPIPAAKMLSVFE